MTQQLKIFIERLEEGDKVIIDETLPPEFLNLQEKEIQTPSNITVTGEAYRLDDLLMLSFNIATEIAIACSICNTPTRVPLQNKNILLSLPLSEIPSTIFDYSELLREEIVILIPQFVECHQGSCPERKSLQPYLKNHNRDTSCHFPFAEL